MTAAAVKTRSARPRASVDASTLLAAACQIVSVQGLSGLTLRPLADTLGVSVSVLTHRYGARADVIAAICTAGCEEDAAPLAQWRDLLNAAGPLSPGLAADLAEAILDDLAARRPALSTLFLELHHASSWDHSLQSMIAPWAAQRQAFWDAFAEQAGLFQPLIDCGWWRGFATMELAHALALGADPSYRLLRKLCLGRLFAGGRAAASGQADVRLFEVLIGRLQQTQAGVDASEGWPALAAHACGVLLAEQGVDALTHRAIAQNIGIPHTTLSYRFPTQRHLVNAGLAFIVEHIRTAVHADSLQELERRRTGNDGHRLDLARASFAVAIAAARMSELAPYAADLRSRRGNNLAQVFSRHLPQVQGIDALCAQVVSMGLTGVINAAAPGAASEDAVRAAFSAAARWLSIGEQA